MISEIDSFLLLLEKNIEKSGITIETVTSKPDFWAFCKQIFSLVFADFSDFSEAPV